MAVPKGIERELNLNKKMSKQSILVDGKNISLGMGTGVATYARNLCKTLKEEGYKTNLLYGVNINQYSESFLKELNFFNQHKALTKKQKIILYSKLLLKTFTTIKPDEINFTDAIIKNSFETILPHSDSNWNSCLIYNYAYWKFHFLKIFQRVSNPMNADIAHWTYPIPIHLTQAKNIYTIHDLVPLRLPYTTLDNKNSYYYMLKCISKKADLIVTVSEQSKRDIHSFIDIPDQKVVNTYQAVSIPEQYLKLPEDILSDTLVGIYGLKLKEYILFYGAIEPKKNLKRLIEAYLSSNLQLPLVIAGKDGWLVDTELELFNNVNERWRNSQEKPKIIRFQYTSFPQLVNLIRGARVIAFPSLYEGFGLPIIEAMICGTPVLTSNIGATKEIAGDAALLVDPYDVRSIAAGLKELAHNKVLASTLIQKGYIQARKFNKENFAKNISQAYREIL